tara:strand:+ start:100 stop:423 length:324 start_codon:yes stop_codon:yes gene_type:complete
MKELSGVLHGTFWKTKELGISVWIKCTFLYDGEIHEMLEISEIDEFVLIYKEKEDTPLKDLLHCPIDPDAEEDLEEWSNWILKQDGRELTEAFAGCEVEDGFHHVIL